MRHRTLIIIILSLLLVGGAAAWKFLPHTLSYDECSDVYRHFADMRLPGVRVTYIQDKIINDTLRIPVTLLQAETDEGWAAIDSLFGLTADRNKLINDTTIPDEVKQMLLNNAPSFTTQRSHRETPEQHITSMDMRPDDVTVYIFHDLRCVTIYETGIPKEESQIYLQNSKELRERTRTQQWNATYDAACDHLDSLDAARDTSASSKNNEIFNNL
ncbi:MAG: hypothetical protein K5842_00140 [Bacteroidales bacterium]|nr:hypothetical protein [Bacteroidales bacterium]